MSKKKFIIFSNGEEDEDLVEDEADDAASGSDADRRRHPRYRIGVLTEIHVNEEERKILPGITFNMSESGAYLMTLAPLIPGDEVTLSFVSADDQRETLRARVVHGTELNKDVFWSQGIGIEFVESMPNFFEVEFSKK